jgi:carboxyl-terminal processing protease
MYDGPQAVAITDKPLVVLIDQGSASASENLVWISARQCSSENWLAQKTFGKGLVQGKVRGLSDGSGLTVTIAKYLTPKGTDIHKNGIEPDVKSEMTEQQAQGFHNRKTRTQAKILNI